MLGGAAPVHLEGILRLLRGASVAVFSQDANLKYRWLQPPPKSWLVADEIGGKTDGDIFPAGAAAAVVAAKREVLTTGQPCWTEFSVDRDRRRQSFELYAEAERDEVGAIVGVVGLLVDVTERRKRLAALEAIVRQSSHRSKNLLAILQSLAVQTARAAHSTEDFIEQYRGRIQSVSRSQDLALRVGSQEVRLSHLIAIQVEPYVADKADKVRFEGDDCDLTTNAALHVGLALFELTVSAADRGLLLDGDAKISITVERVRDAALDAADASLRVRWVESGAGPASLQGFTQQLLERLIPSALGGRGTLSSTDEGISYELTIAPGEFRELP